MKPIWRGILALLLLGQAFGCWGLFLSCDAQAQPNSPQPASGPDLVYEPPLSDALEPVNRSIGFVNHGIMLGIIDPTSRLYRLILPKPVRKCVNNAGHNLAYPVRLVNNLLQAQWSGSWVETKRFGVNTTVGILGLFDPATKWGIGESVEDTGLTFQQWGWRHRLYLMLPFFGPSSERDVIGKVGDFALNPATYFFPAGPIFTYNRLSDEIIRYKQFTSSQYDPYALSRDIWAYSRLRVDQGTTPDVVDDSALETLESVAIKTDDPKFAQRRKKRKAHIPGIEEKLPYSLWLQKEPSPVVYVLPGFGSHREDSSAVVSAEWFHREGYHVVALSSAMNWEFINKGATSLIPGYAPRDVRDVMVALEAVDADVRSRYPDRFGDRYLMGSSMGGFHTLLAAVTDHRTRKGAPFFKGYLAVNPPVDLLYGVRQLDTFYNAPLAWPAAEREERMEAAIARGAVLAQADPEKVEIPTLDPREAQYLIGLRYRVALRDLIHASQRQYPLHIIRSGLGTMRREPAYQEIAEYSFQEYFETFVLTGAPIQEGRQISQQQIQRASDLRSYEADLRAIPSIQVFTNENDFLLSESDVRWLKSVFGDRLDLCEKGGHMGNLHQREVQGRICHQMRTLSGR